jgi:hypothetical protein
MTMSAGSSCGIRFPGGVSPERSRLERIVLHALAGDRLRISGVDYIPIYAGLVGYSLSSGIGWKADHVADGRSY